MTNRYRTFLSDLYEEHVEEAAFLYEHQFALQADEEISWLELEDFEQRFEAHLDALVVGSEHAQAIASGMVEDGDGAVLHVYVCLLGRNNQLTAFMDLLKSATFGNMDACLPTSRALLAEAPLAWTQGIGDQFSALRIN